MTGGRALHLTRLPGSLKFARLSGQTYVHIVIANFNASCNAICVDRFPAMRSSRTGATGRSAVEYHDLPRSASEHGATSRAHVLYGVFAALYALFVGLSCAVEGSSRKRRQKARDVVALYSGASGSHAVDLVRMLHHAIYAKDGKGAPKLVNAAMALSLVADGGVLLCAGLVCGRLAHRAPKNSCRAASASRC